MESSKKTWVEALEAYFADYQTWLTDIVLLGGAAVVAGILLKNFGKYIIGALLIAALTIIGLSYSGLATLSFVDVLARLGISGVASPADFVTFMGAWVQTHVVGTVSIIIGFILGWKLG